METLEGIFQVLQQHHVLHSPSMELARLSPLANKSTVFFAEQIRTSFYQLPRTRQAESLVRTMLLDNVKKWMPSVFKDLRFDIPKSDTRELVNLIVITARQEIILTEQKNRFALSKSEDLEKSDKNTITMYSRNDNNGIFPANEDAKMDEAFAVDVKSNKCFNCNKLGHWAKDCDQKPISQNKALHTSGKNIIIKGKILTTKFMTLQQKKNANPKKNPFPYPRPNQ